MDETTTKEAVSLSEFSDRLAKWLREQPEVTEVEQVMAGENEIYGFVLDGVGISLGLNETP